MRINNRRYTGSKYKLMPWIRFLIEENCQAYNSLFDVFGGTGVVSAGLLDMFDKIVINDFLYSNKIIYEAFFNNEPFDKDVLLAYEKKYSSLSSVSLAENYVSLNYGDKYFSNHDARKIGYIRQDLEESLNTKKITYHEFCILLASLLYSFDRCANTVGHYEAYIKKTKPADSLKFELIEPIQTNNKIEIYREDANALARRIKCDVAFVDPPYNSRQYSRFYHVLETITKWDKPKLSGTALKPPAENMSDYCRSSAPQAFNDLIKNLNAKFIVVTYNNTYDSKSSSSRNKIKLEQIEDTLNAKGKTITFAKEHHRFNAGKTESSGHKEYVFICEVFD